MTDELYPLAERNKFPWQLADAQFLRGWLAAQGGDFDAGIEVMSESRSPPGGAAFGPMYAVLIVEQELRAGNVERALARIERAVDDLKRQGQLVLRARAVSPARRSVTGASAARHDAAERDLREALAMSRKQACRPLELRAATSLARLLRDSGREAEARDLLAPVYAAFTEGFERARSAGGERRCWRN